MRLGDSGFQQFVGWGPRILRQNLFERPLNAVCRFFDELKLHGPEIGLIAAAELNDLQGTADMVIQLGDGPHPLPGEFLFPLFVPGELVEQRTSD